jgi:hypothetical protein
MEGAEQPSPDDGAAPTEPAPPPEAPAGAPPDAGRPTEWRGWKWLGIVGSIASIIAIPASIFFWLDGRSLPDLSYFVYPERIELVNELPGESFKVFFKDRQLNPPVTVALVELWNAGRKPIRKEDILDSIQVSLDPPAEILTTEIVRRANERPIELQLDRTLLSSGKVPISWKILEKGDGAVLQLTYAGGPATKISVSGVVVGQDRIRASGSAAIQAVHKPWGTIVAGVVMLLLGAMALSSLRAPPPKKPDTFSVLLEALSNMERYASVPNPAQKAIEEATKTMSTERALAIDRRLRIISGLVAGFGLIAASLYLLLS